MGDNACGNILKEKTEKDQFIKIMTNKNSVSSTSSKDNDSAASTNARPKLVFFWTNAEVLKWLRRHCEEYHTLYASLFLENDITGRSLLRMNDSTLERMGIKEKVHREVICTEILKLKLKSDILELKDLQKKKAFDSIAGEYLLAFQMLALLLSLLN